MSNRLGFTYNGTDIQASLGPGQLGQLAAFDARCRAVVPAYTEACRDEVAGTPGWGSIPLEPAILSDTH